MNITGLDLSLVETGIADALGARHLSTPAAKFPGMARLQHIRNQVLFAALETDTVYLEGYSFGSKNGGERLGELGGVVRLALYEKGIPFVEVSPGTLKMFATGRGNASKVEVLVAARDRLGYTGTNDNEADALWLWQLGLHHTGQPDRVSLPKGHLRALEKLK
jgi:crossover junction endodeoxyribonuclease RuvC